MIGSGPGLLESEMLGSGPLPTHCRSFPRCQVFLPLFGYGRVRNSYHPLSKADLGSLLVGRDGKEHLVQPAAPYRISGAPPITACLPVAGLGPSAPSRRGGLASPSTRCPPSS